MTKLFDQEPEKHESYGMVGFSRVSCSPPANLFGSSIKHGHFIELTIMTASKRRDYQKDWYHGEKTLVKVALSATQFAEALTNMNCGDGVPCTIEMVVGDKDRREPCPEISFRQQATEELKEEMHDLARKVQRLSKDSKEILAGKGTTIKSADKKKLLDDLNSVVAELQSNIPFVHECFNESVDKTLTEAKGELDATFQAFRERLGDKALEAHKVMEVPLLEDGEQTNEADPKDE